MSAACSVDSASVSTTVSAAAAVTRVTHLPILESENWNLTGKLKAKAKGSIRKPWQKSTGLKSRHLMLTEIKKNKIFKLLVQTFAEVFKLYPSLKENSGENISMFHVLGLLLVLGKCLLLDKLKSQCRIYFASFLYIY